MNTKILMSLTALLMGTLGLIASFMPREILSQLGSTPNSPNAIWIQVGGAAYLGFAMLNWTARTNPIGGIYGRPVALGNFIHFAVAALALLKAVIGGSSRTYGVLVGAFAYSAFAVWYGLVLFTHLVTRKPVD
ncbi:MAG TPA: hypothetical protein VFD13_09445 [Candidatus Kapabacteria bacterium]|nr:hypothetical protein [Candidatus Kapabacteria bacterium]